MSDLGNSNILRQGGRLNLDLGDNPFNITTVQEQCSFQKSASYVADQSVSSQTTKKLSSQQSQKSELSSTLKKPEPESLIEPKKTFINLGSDFCMLDSLQTLDSDKSIELLVTESNTVQTKKANQQKSSMPHSSQGTNNSSTYFNKLLVRLKSSGYQAQTPSNKTEISIYPRNQSSSIGVPKKNTPGFHLPTESSEYHREMRSSALKENDPKFANITSYYGISPSTVGQKHLKINSAQSPQSLTNSVSKAPSQPASNTKTRLSNPTFQSTTQVEPNHRISNKFSLKSEKTIPIPSQSSIYLSQYQPRSSNLNDGVNNSSSLANTSFASRRISQQIGVFDNKLSSKNLSAILKKSKSPVKINPMKKSFQFQ